MIDASDMVLDDFGGGIMPTSYLPKSKKDLAAHNLIPTGHVGSRPRPVGAFRRLYLTRDTGVIWRSYYFAGGARIAMREDSDQGSEVFYILTDHLSSTSKVVQVDEDEVTITAQQWYKPWGEPRQGTGQSPTDYTFTGQRNPGWGLTHFGARWFDSALGRFAQADSIIPGAGNPLAWDRYAGLFNNPMNLIDPSGYRPQRDIDFDAFFGITFECSGGGADCWSEEYKNYVRSAVFDTAGRLSDDTGLTHAEAFQAVYGITEKEKFKFLIGPCEPRNGHGGCADENGDKIGAYTWGAREVEFYEGTPFMQDFADDNRTPGEVFGFNVHTVVHELGHAFAHRVSEDNPSNPYNMLGDAKYKYLLSDEGYAPSPNPGSLGNYWTPNSKTTPNETFANMFVGHVYGAWGRNDLGSRREVFMTTNIVNTWLPIILEP